MTTAPPPEHGPDVELGTADLRVLAHPVRLNVLALLRQRGPSTATRVGEELGIKPGAASYHLRRLAAGGLIVEDPERGTARDRWWKAAHGQSVHDPGTAPPGRRAVDRAYTHAVALSAADHLRRAAQEVPLLPPEWFGVTAFSDFVLHLTPHQLMELKGELYEVVARHRERAAQPGEGTAPVSLRVQAYPVPGAVELTGEGP
jgi:DNA-binding transcriptional ArsR family regulator